MAPQLPSSPAMLMLRDRLARWPAEVEEAAEPPEADWLS